MNYTREQTFHNCRFQENHQPWLYTRLNNKILVSVNSGCNNKMWLRSMSVKTFLRQSDLSIILYALPHALTVSVMGQIQRCVL